MKKIILLLLAIFLVACNQTANQPATETDANIRTVEVEASGFNKEKPMKLKVSVSDNKIEAIEILESHETQGIGKEAAEKLAEAVVKQQTLELDAVTGATVTSTAFLEAISKALDEVHFDKSKLSANKNDETANTEVKKLSADVVVVGAGGAGLAAAIEAADAGKKVIVLEKTALTGGNTTRATGGMNAVGTDYQQQVKFEQSAGVEKVLAKAKEQYPELNELTATVEKQWQVFQAKSGGYFDTVELFMLDALVGGKNLNNHDLVRVLASNSKQTIEWLKAIGADLKEVGSFGGASVKRIHKPVNEEGKTIAVGSYLVPILTDVAKEKGVEFLFETPAQELIVADGKVVGVKAKGYEITAKAVVLATGGFGANFEMVESYRPNLKGFVTTNNLAMVGDGIKMAEAIGAAVVDMDQIQIHPTVEQNTSSLITEGLRGDGAILFNQEGKRFVDETSTRDVVSAAEIEQPGGYAYLLVDKQMLDASSVIAGYIAKGFTTEGESIEDLATKLDIDPATLKETIDTWNKAVENQKDEQFNRTAFAKPLSQAPYYVVKVAPGIHHTMGGLQINVNSEVLDTKGEIIPGLFAAGEVTGGVHGANRLGGNAVTDIMVFGRIAGQNAAKYAK